MSRSRGYTLLEIMLVIALLALATSLVAPAGYRMATSWARAADVEKTLREIGRLPLRARDSGSPLHFAPGEEAPLAQLLDLPDGWTLSLDQPLLVRANGACSGTTATLQTGASGRIPLVIRAPFCQATPAP